MADISDNTQTTAVLETSTDGGTGTFSGQLKLSGDHDWIRVTLTAGNTYNFFLAAQNVGESGGDSELSLRDTSGAEVASNDDNGVNLNSFVAFKPLTTGTFYLDVFNHLDLDRGAYSILMTHSNTTNVFLHDQSEFLTANAGQAIAAGVGDDVITMNPGAFDAVGEQGNDQLDGNAGSNILSGGLGNDVIFGDAGSDFIFGDAGDDFLAGGNDNDQLFGGDGLDDLGGGSGNDTLIGGLGADILFGGSESDVFVFKSIADSVKGANRDQIFDFSHAEGDKIDVSGIDANTHKHGNQAFHFIGSHHFDHHAGELRYAHHLLQGDVNGDGRVDFEIQVNADSLLKGDFFL